MSLKLGIRKYFFPISKPVTGPFYFPSRSSVKNFREEWKEGLFKKANNVMCGKFTWFSYHEFDMGRIPNWFYNPFENKKVNGSKIHWTKLGDFSLNAGDIKVIWELSRFGWLTDLARAHVVSKDLSYLSRLNELLDDWCLNNPLNQGPQWKCGQEASFRVFQLITTAHILSQSANSSETLQRLVFQHLQRIRPNINYALAQLNNHSTSETAALYIGSAWLIHNKYDKHQLLKWKEYGRNRLEQCLMKLIQQEGSFSQNSANYHRVIVDTMSFVIHNMDVLGEIPFSQVIEDRLSALGEWQYKMTFGKDGEVPNLGNNDGTMINNLHGLTYTDYRPSTQTFFGCLRKSFVYSDDRLNEALYWYYRNELSDFKSLDFSEVSEEVLDGQYLILHKGKCSVLMNLPTDKFRPGNDALHIDVWVSGNCILRDNGTFSYNHELSDVFKSVKSHNTIQFGSHEQLPKISRFLNGGWFSIDHLQSFSSDKEILWKASYTDCIGNKHQRKLVLTDHSLIVSDIIDTTEEAEIHFHLAGHDPLIYFTDSEVKKYTIAESMSSNYYLQKEKAILLTNKIVRTNLLKINLDK